MGTFVGLDIGYSNVISAHGTSDVGKRSTNPIFK